MPNPSPSDRWDLADLGLVFEEDAEDAESHRADHDPRLIEVLSELGIQELDPAPLDPDPDSAEDDAVDQHSDGESAGWLVNDKSLVDN